MFKFRCVLFSSMSFNVWIFVYHQNFFLWEWVSLCMTFSQLWWLIHSSWAFSSWFHFGHVQTHWIFTIVFIFLFSQIYCRDMIFYIEALVLRFVILLVLHFYGGLVRLCIRCLISFIIFWMRALWNGFMLTTLLYIL